MTTFPQQKRANFEKGLNVIFGPNHSGKTTIINSIRYGIFGLSLCHIPDSVEIKYFSSRINEKQRKSLDISTVYNIKSSTIAVNRVIFSSGSPTIEANVSHNSENALSIPTITIDHEKDYIDYIKTEMGINPDNLALMSDLLFADENRQTFLWLHEIDQFILDLLTSSEASNKLNAIDRDLKNAKENLKKMEDLKKKIILDNSQRHADIKLLKKDLEKIEKSEVGKSIEERKNVIIDLQQLRNKISQSTDSLNQALQTKLSLMRQIDSNTKKIEKLNLKKDNCKADAIKAFLNSGDAEKNHLNKAIYFDKKCPICYSDLTMQINSRLNSQKCPLCGEGSVPGDGKDIDEIQGLIKEIDNEIKTISEVKLQLEDKVETSDHHLTTITQEIEKYRLMENNLLDKLNKSKSFEEELFNKELIIRQIKGIDLAIENNTKKQSLTESEINELNISVDKLETLYLKTTQSNKLEINNALESLKQRFSTFISLATNGEKTGTLSEQFVPILDGRPIYNPAIVSQSEKILLDYAFRIAIVSICAENSNTVASMVLETPDEVIDGSFLSSTSQAIRYFSSNLSIIVTTFNTDIIELLLKGYDLEGKNRQRLTNLLTNEGTLTQKKYYEPKLVKYSSEI
jgi:hypothetical protein